MKTQKERLIQTNETPTLPETRQAMRSMPEKKSLDKKTKTFQTCVMEVKVVKGP